MTIIGPNHMVFRVSNIPRTATHRTVHLTDRGLPVGYGFIIGNGRLNNSMGRNW